MTKALKSVALTAAFALFTAGAPSLMALAPQYQNHDQNRADEHMNQDHSTYYSNDFYRLGNREGYQDYQHKTQRTEHNHKYRSDDDRKAHDYGYQDGLQGHRYSNNDNRPH